MHVVKTNMSVWRVLDKAKRYLDTVHTHTYTLGTDNRIQELPPKSTKNYKATTCAPLETHGKDKKSKTKTTDLLVLPPLYYQLPL